MNAVPSVDLGLTAYRMGPSLRRPRLLVVDDQPLNIQAMYQAFSADHQVLMATGGEQALGICVNRHPDLILLDVSMPGMDGFEMCRRLKADPSTRDIPVIFVTAHSDVASETRGLELGAADFISKPINPKIVRARVKTHLTLKAQSDLLRQWAYLDGLTGVYNRRYFDERLAAEWDRSVRTGTALSIILLDVDFFKRYNDRYGHQTGDDCLREIAVQLKEGLRQPADFVARYGGEEFVCLLPDTNFDGAFMLAQRLGEQIFKRQIEHADSSVAAMITVSLGVSSKTRDGADSAASLLREADAQLYQAKANGRHRVCGVDRDLPLSERCEARMDDSVSPRALVHGPGSAPMHLLPVRQ